MEPSDFELLAAWGAGDRTAGSALFARHFDAVYRFFRSKVAEADIEDLVQRVFLGCIEGRERFRGESSFRTYLYHVAGFQLYAHFRARRGAQLVGLPTTSVRNLRDLGTSPTGVIARNEQRRSLLAALQGLPIDLQIAVELRYWEQLTEQEIGVVLGIARGTVAGRLRRAMDVVEMLKRPEGKTLEWKRDLSSPDGVLRTIVGFANTAGGTVLIVAAPTA